MKATMEIVKFDVNDIVTTSAPACPTDMGVCDLL